MPQLEFEPAKRRKSPENAVVSYNVGEFPTDDPKEITVYNDNVNTAPTGIAFDSQKDVYISELYSGTAVKYPPIPRAVSPCS